MAAAEQVLARTQNLVATAKANESAAGTDYVMAVVKRARAAFDAAAKVGR